MSARTPEEVLAELGEALRRAPVPRRRRSRILRGALLGAALGGALVPAALAVLPHGRPDLTRPTGAKRPDAVSRPQLVAAGDDWRLTATRCRFGARTTVALRLTVPGAGAGRRCDALAPAAVAGPVAPPVQLVDVARGRSLVFGAVPRGTARVRVLLAHGSHEVPTTGGVFMAILKADDRLLGTLGLAGGGLPTFHCDPERCR
jgi:hypothetical protein